MKISNTLADWYRFYPSLFPKFDVENIESVSPTHYKYFIKLLYTSNINRIWFPACAHTLLTHALAANGFNIIATDIDLSVIEFQKTYNSQLLEKITVDKHQSGQLLIQPLGLDEMLESTVDLAISSISLDVLSENIIDEFAVQLGLALAPRGILIFDASSSCFSRQVYFQNKLIENDFYVPYAEIDSNCLQRLDSTHIDYKFIFGYPTVLRQGKYEKNRELWEEDYLRIAEIADNYREHRNKISQTISSKSVKNLERPFASILTGLI